MQLDEIIERLEKAAGADRYTDCHLWVLGRGGDARMVVCDSSTQDFVWERGIGGMWIRDVMRFRSVPKYTSSVDAALALAERVLPGWMWRVASCSVSDDSWVCPDFNHPEMGQQFHAMFDGAFEGRDPAEAIYEATDVDQRPSGQPALALVKSTLRGLRILRALSNQSGGER